MGFAGLRVEGFRGFMGLRNILRFQGLSRFPWI